MYFAVYVLGFWLICSAQLSLLVNLGTAYLPDALAKFCVCSAKHAALAFFLAASSNIVRFW